MAGVSYTQFLIAAAPVVHYQLQEKVQALKNSEKVLKSNWILKHSCNHFSGRGFRDRREQIKSSHKQ